MPNRSQTMDAMKLPPIRRYRVVESQPSPEFLSSPFHSHSSLPLRYSSEWMFVSYSFRVLYTIPQKLLIEYNGFN